jgi:hypothetical protein
MPDETSKAPDVPTTLGDRLEHPSEPSLVGSPTTTNVADGSAPPNDGGPGSRELSAMGGRLLPILAVLGTILVVSVVVIVVLRLRRGASLGERYGS